MALVALKQLFLALTLLFGCAGGPDELELSYGHQFAGDSRLGEGGGHSWPMTNDDSDFIGVGLVWKLRPTEVVVRNPVTPAVRWTLEPTPTTLASAPQDPTPTTDPQDPTPPTPEDQDPEHTVADHIDVGDAVSTFNQLDWITRICLLVAVCWLGFVYRVQLGRLIPGSGKKGKAKSEPKPKS